MSTSNPTEKEERIYSIFSADQFDKVIDEISTAPLPTKWYLVVVDGEWKKYTTEAKQLRFGGEISHEEIEKILGPATNGAEVDRVMVERWKFDAFSDDKYDYIFCVDIFFVDNVAVSGLVYWDKITRED